MLITSNGNCLGHFRDGKACSHNDCDHYVCQWAQTNNSRKKAESKVKVTKKVIRCKKIKCHDLDPMSSGETPMRL